MYLPKPALGVFGFLLIFVAYGTAAAQEWHLKHAESKLWNAGTAAYAAVPEHPSPSDGDVFLRALANLYAYAEVSRGRDRPRAQQVSQALNWLIENMGSVTPAEGKGDDIAREVRIQDRGLAAYDSLKRGVARSRFRSYAAALTNLYVARQMIDDLPGDAINALKWLSANPVRPGTTGKADATNETNPFPRRAKPNAFGQAPPTPPQGERGERGEVDPRAETAASNASPLNGRWRADDGGTYYVRQIGRDVWWLGESADNGASWSNIFFGKWDAATGTITGTWMDIPKGSARSSGELVLQVVGNGRLFRAARQSGGFGGRIWRRLP